MDRAFDIAQQRNDLENALRPMPTPEERLRDLLSTAARLRKNIASEDWQYGPIEHAARRRKTDREVLRMVEDEIRGLITPALKI